MIRIVTDSTCEAPPDLLRNPAVTVVPLHVIFGQDSYQDNIEMTREQFWARLPESDKLPTTSQVTPAQFEVPFKAFTDAGDEVIAITLSAKLSRTYESALLAKDSLPGRAIDVVDSKSISVGLGLVVQQAVEMASAGTSRAEIVAKLEQMREADPPALHPANPGIPATWRAHRQGASLHGDLAPVQTAAEHRRRRGASGQRACAA